MQTSPPPAEGTRTGFHIPGPSEGWLTFVLLGAAVVIAGLSVSDSPGLDGTVAAVPLVVAGYLLGFLLAKTRLPDLAVHLVMLLAAPFVGATLVTIQTVEWFPGFRELGSATWSTVRGIGETLVSGAFLDDTQSAVLFTSLLLLLGYATGWLLFRRGWLGAALSLPGAVTVAAILLDWTASPLLLPAFIVISLVLAARFHAFRMTAHLGPSGAKGVRRLGARAAMAGLLLAITAMLLGSLVQANVPEPDPSAIADRAGNLVEQATERLGDLSGVGSSTKAPADYADFEPSFSVDGEVNLGNDPVVVLKGDSPRYLAARRLDAYDGAGWLESDDQGDSDRPALVAFDAGQPMNLSPDQQGGRSPVADQVVLLVPIGGLLLTTDTHYSVDVRSSASIAWMTIDQSWDLWSVPLTDLPIDIQPLATDLVNATIVPDPNGVPVIQEQDVAARVEDERERLRQQYPLETTLTLVDGRPQLAVTGRVPIYGDVQAVFDRGDLQDGQPYTAIGLQSVATPDELRAAGTEWPAEVRDRYLALPPSVTERTTTLAAQVVADADATTEWDAAWAIQQYLRETYPYELNGPSAPDGQDAVDYFLFDRQAGRCTHFASAMAVMVRSLGYPARVVAGFAPGTWDESYGGYVSRASDAHTWVEVYFPGYGWIPFEPTPSQDEVAPGAVQPAPATATVVPTETLQPTETAATVTEAAATGTVTQTLTPSPEATPVVPSLVEPGSSDDGPPGWLVPLLAVGGTLLVAGVFAAGAWRFGLRGLRPGSALYARARRLGRLRGIEAPPTVTAAEYADRFAQRVPQGRDAIDQVAALYDRERYGPPATAGSANDAKIRETWRSLRNAMLGRSRNREPGKG